MDKRIFPLALTLIPGIGCTSAHHLFDLFPDAEAIFSLSHSELLAVFGNRSDLIEAIEQRSSFPRAAQELTFLDRYGISLLAPSDPHYPHRLNRSDCADTPAVLFQKGDCDLNDLHIVSVVGTRRATQYGKMVTRRLVEQLAAFNVLVVSGLAYGIDTAAHTAALEFGLPTVAVLGHGLDHIYPPQNASLARNIVAHGALVTEYLNGSKINACNFPARNRIIAALADATIVVEASNKGGALITASIAASYNRDVFAVPGRLFDPYSEGCNSLIADNKASILRSADDLALSLNWMTPSTSPAPSQQKMVFDLPPDEQKVYDAIYQNDEPTSESLSDLTAIPLAALSALLLNLELKGYIRSIPGNRYAIS